MQEVELELEKLLKSFGENLRATRKEKQFSYRKLSSLSNIDPSDIKRYEDGKKNLTLVSIVQLAKGLNVHPSTLLKFTYLNEFFQNEG